MDSVGRWVCCFFVLLDWGLNDDDVWIRSGACVCVCWWLAVVFVVIERVRFSLLLGHNMMVAGIGR